MGMSKVNIINVKVEKYFNLFIDFIDFIDFILLIRFPILLLFFIFLNNNILHMHQRNKRMLMHKYNILSVKIT
jgi:hypothetical protein